MTSPGDRPILSHSRRQVTALAAIAFGNFWLAACLSLQAPFFPKEAQIKGASETQHGLIMGTYELFIGLGSPVFGKLLSCVQAKYLALFGLLLAGVSTILFGLLDLVPAGGTFVTLAFVLRTLEGIGAASFETSTYTLMASEFPERVASIFAILETSYGLGLILGPTIGGALYQAGGYTLPFVAAGSLILCVGIIIIICVNSSATKVSRSAAMLDFFRDGTILVNALSIATATNMVGFNSATLEPHLRQFNLTPLAIGFVFVLIGAVYAATGPVFGKLCDKGYDPKAICIMGCVLCIAGAILVGPLPWIDQPAHDSVHSGRHGPHRSGLLGQNSGRLFLFL
ncbi:MFS-type transporter SLC18B1 [Halotydeus destructor]|nr:MFS-type transporter SLC18B1 [Halotydeus destructor]